MNIFTRGDRSNKAMDPKDAYQILWEAGSLPEAIDLLLPDKKRLLPLLGPALMIAVDTSLDLARQKGVAYQGAGFGDWSMPYPSTGREEVRAQREMKSLWKPNSYTWKLRDGRVGRLASWSCYAGPDEISVSEWPQDAREGTRPTYSMAIPRANQPQNYVVVEHAETQSMPGRQRAYEDQSFASLVSATPEYANEDQAQILATCQWAARLCFDAMDALVQPDRLDQPS